MEKTRLRIRFTKTGNLRWISHKDLARVWERLLRRANLQMVFSEGFHPKPRINFPSALALGIEALEEIVELEVKGQVDLEKVEQDIRAEMPDGMELIELQSPDYALGKAKVVAASYRIAITSEQRSEVQENIDKILSSGRIMIQRDEKTITCDVSDDSFRLQHDDHQLNFTIPVLPQGSIRPAEVLAQLGLAESLDAGAVLQRTKVHLSQPDDATVKDK